MPDVSELRKQLQEAEDAQREARSASAKALLPLEYEWSIVWKTGYVFYCGKKLTDACKLAIKNWENFHKCTFPHNPWGGADVFQGMEYVLIGDLLVQVSGGTLVLKATPDGLDHFSHEPRKLTPDQESALREGLVPNSLKR